MTSPEIFLREATEIGDYLTKSAIRWGEFASWVGRQAPEKVTKENYKQASPHAVALNHTLYAGTAGVGLFLANLYRHTGSLAHWEVARGAALQSIRQAEAVPKLPNADRRELLGFYSGIVGPIWAAHEVAALLDDRYVAERALGLVEKLEELSKTAVYTDVMSGHAGAVPALLSLHRDHGVKRAHDLALAVADHLLARATDKDGMISWAPPSSKFAGPLTGYSHGAAGYALAFAELFAATGDEKWREVSEKAIAYERHCFDRENRGWPDFRLQPDARGKYLCQSVWCHGHGGIGVSRIVLSRILDDPMLLEEARIAHQGDGRFTREMIEVPGANHTLCHGVAGNTECLWLVEEGLGRTDALDRARACGELAIHRYGHLADRTHGGRFVDWPTGHPGHRELSLMMGIAGIGYHNLRLYAPDQVPTVLVAATSHKDTKRASTPRARAVAIEIPAM